MTTTAGTSLEQLLGDEAESLLAHRCTTIPAERLTVPGPTWVNDVMASSDRPVPVLRSLQSIFDHGRLGGTGYVSILPVDQGIEHSAGASFAPNPDFFDPLKIIELAIEGGCNAVATTLGALGLASRRFAHRIPFLLKINHNEFLSYPNGYDQIMFASVKQARDLGAVAVGATIYFGSPESKRQIVEVVTGLRRRARARHGDGAVVLHAQLGLQPQGRRSRLPRRRRPHEPGQSPGRHHRGRHHQAEAPRDRRPPASPT